MSNINEGNHHLVTHGMSRTRIYKVYRGMLDRTSNPNIHNYSDYGGRGVRVCADWADKETGFISFYNWAMVNGYSDNLSIDRVNVDGNYEPSNCRWVTQIKQQNNKRNSAFITHKGETKTKAEWARSIGCSAELINGRLKRGWSVEKALETPIIPFGATNARDFTYQGRTQSLGSWARELNISYDILAGRIKRGWTIERTLSTPAGQRRSSAKKGRS